MKRVLLCALDWGLGHATRCIPVVRELQRQGAQVFLASSGDAGHLLRSEFPTLSYHELPGYQPRYQQRGSLVIRLAMQLPKFMHAMRLEHEEVEALARNLRLDAVISDNRYGCFSTAAKSVFITHQLHVRLLKGWGLLEPVVNRKLHSFISRYDNVWVPDQPGSGLTTSFLSGQVPHAFVGWLSRFPTEQQTGKATDVMVLVSGPEPQRSAFEKKITEQARSYPGSVLIVQGKPASPYHAANGTVEVVNHLLAGEMEARIRSAGSVVARSGYSTIMDLIALGKKAIFVPTPQQPEQELLARLLDEQGIAFCQDQKNFVLSAALKESIRYRGLGALTPMKGLLEKEVSMLLS